MNRLPIAAKAAWLAVKTVYTSIGAAAADWYQTIRLAVFGAATFTALRRQVRRNAYASRGVRLVADTVASVELYATRPGSEDAIPQPKSLPLLDSATYDGRRLSRADLLRTITRHVYLSGEYFLERETPATGPNAGRALRLTLHRPDRITEIVRNRETDEVTGYRVSRRDGRARFVEAQSMYHGLYDLDEERGEGLLASALRALESMESADRWNLTLSSEAGRVSGYWSPQNLMPGEILSRSDVEQAEAAIDARKAERTGRDMVLSGQFKREDAFVSPRDAEFSAADRESARRVAIAIGIDPALIGDSSNRTYSNLKEAREALYMLTVLPFVEWLLEGLDAACGAGERLVVNRDKIDAIQEDLTDKFRRYVLASGGPFLTPNEAREEMEFDRAAQEGMDEVRRVGTLPAAGPPRGQEPGDRAADPLRSLLDAPEEQYQAVIKRLAA